MAAIVQWFFVGLRVWVKAVLLVAILVSVHLLVVMVLLVALVVVLLLVVLESNVAMVCV